MPDPSTSLRAGRDQTGFSRTCPACGRRVPRSVATCRCGATLPVESSALPAEVTETARGGGSTLAVGLVVVAALVGAAYWTFTGSATPSPSTSVRPDVAVPAEAAANEVARTASPEARAWDAAAANAKDSPSPTAPVNTPSNFPAPSNAPAGSIEEMVDQVMPAIVLIQATGGRGSGFFVNRDTLLTNVHVVGDDSYVTLKRMDGTTATGRVESRAPAFDIAVLKVAQPLAAQPAIPMGSSQSLKPGQEIIVIGSALGTLQNSVSRGIVSGLRAAGGATLVQTDAAINPGNSGGPMLDRNGTVIGITTMSYRNAEGLNFGVAIEHARDLLEGRQANLGSTRGLTDIQSQSRGSESDRRQQQGEDQFRARVGQLAEAARRIDAVWARFRKDCYRSPIGGGYDREWFAVLVPRGIPGDAAAGCISYYNTAESDIRQFKSLMRDVVNDARRANVLPGTIREALQAHRLDFDWER